MRFNLRLNGHTVKGENCIADISVYGAELCHQKVEEVAKYAVWFIDKPGFPMVDMVKFDSYREHQDHVQEMPVMQSNSFQDIFSSIFGTKTPLK